MSITTVPEKVRLRLWGKAGGRCEYDGCNEPLWLDSATQVEFNVAYIAHIVADKPNGPRGDKDLSGALAGDLSNLMLLCDKHHRLIDKEQVREHPVERLTAMKRKHEVRIELLGSLAEEKQSHVVLYGANIGSHASPVSLNRAAFAMLPERYPAESQALEIGLLNSAITDRTSEYWRVEYLNIEAKVVQQLRPRLALGGIRHLSVFALAPQPLLIALGHLLSDIPATDVYQLHREPPDWRWQDGADADVQEFRVDEPSRIEGSAALVFSLSGSIEDERVRRILPDATLWKVSIGHPHNDFLKARRQANAFRVLMRKCLDRIKLAHGQDGEIHVFPAMPVALAVELGRIRMPKADLPLRIYDEDRSQGGFRYALTIDG